MEILEKNCMYVSIGDVSDTESRLSGFGAVMQQGRRLKKLVHCRLSQNGFDMVYFLLRCLCGRNIVTFLACDFIQFLL